MQNWKLKIIDAGKVYRDEGPFEEVMTRLRAACPHGKLIEATRQKEAEVKHMLLAELETAERKAAERGDGNLVETARALRRHIQTNGQMEMQDADAVSFLLESLAQNALEVA